MKVILIQIYLLVTHHYRTLVRNSNPHSAQAVSDLFFRISFRDYGNRNRTSVIFMTFGQFMDHDFAYVVHGPASLSPES